MANANLCLSSKRFNNPQIIPPPVAENFRVPGEPTFAEAAAHYLQAGGEARYLPPIVAYFADTPLKAIYPAHLRAMADALYRDRKGATKNRQAITPARAVILYGYDHGWCNRMTVKRFKVEKPKRPKAATAIWFYAFCTQCHRDGLPHLAAIVMFMATTGARISEAVRLEWPEVDMTERKVVLLRTKTTTNSVRDLTDDVVGRLREMEKVRDGHERVFRYRSRHSVNERIRAVCERAGIPNKAPHTCGRRAFANMTMDMGMSIIDAMKAGGWESTPVFLEMYVQARANAGRIVADRFNTHVFNGM